MRIGIHGPDFIDAKKRVYSGKSIIAYQLSDIIAINNVYALLSADRSIGYLPNSFSPQIHLTDDEYNKGYFKRLTVDDEDALILEYCKEQELKISPIDSLRDAFIIPFNLYAPLNYYHSLIEFLPVLYCLAKDQSTLLDQSVLLCGEGLPYQIQELIRTLLGTTIRIEYIKNNEYINISQGLMLKPALHEYWPVEQDAGRMRSEDILTDVNYYALERFRKGVFEAHGSMEAGRASDPLVRIYIDRSSRYRNIVNRDEVEDLLRGYGFTSIKPETLSFSEQLAIFSSADLIVGPSGAWCSNLAFSSPEAKCLILYPDSLSHSYEPWDILFSLGSPCLLKTRSIFGKTMQEKHEIDIHSSFLVSTTELENAILLMTN